MIQVIRDVLIRSLMTRQLQEPYKLIPIPLFNIQHTLLLRYSLLEQLIDIQAQHLAHLLLLIVFLITLSPLRGGVVVEFGHVDQGLTR